jgi:SAM-dependent methyltransferase
MAVTLPARLARFLPALACPACDAPLDALPAALLCSGCGVRYPVRNGRAYFVAVPEPSDDELDSLKGWLKRKLGRWYYVVGVRVFAPTYPFGFARRLRRALDCSTRLVVDAGCGADRVAEDALGVDLYDYPAVDVVCDLARLPFRPGSLDAIVTRSVLEHVPDPEAVVRGFLRCTRAGGLGMHQVPFLFPFHAAPHDYRRFTHMGLRRLFAGWQVSEQVNAAGPVTLALLAFIELVSTLLSFGRPGPKALVYLMLCAVLFPLKLLDAPFIGRAAMLPMAPSIFLHVVKP